KHGALEGALAELGVDIESKEEVRKIFLFPNVLDRVQIVFRDPEPDRVRQMLCDEFDFSVERINAALEKFGVSRGLQKQKSLDGSRDRASLFIAVSGEDKIAVVDIAERSVTRNLTLNFTPLSVRDGRSDRLYVTGSDRVVRVLNGTTGQELANSSLFSYQTIAEVSPDGFLLLLTTTDVSALVIAAFDIQNDMPAFLRYSHPH